MKNPDDPHDLRCDINILRPYIIEHARKFAQKIKGQGYAADGEYPDGKTTTKVRTDTQTLITDFGKNPEDILEKYFQEGLKGDIEGLAPFLFHNILVGKFQDFDTIFHGSEPRFHMITSVRGDSHIDNIAYKNLIRSSCKKLKPGGIVISDGIRRSYTRECRWKEMHDLASELGDDYRFYFIKSSSGDILSVFIQRVAVTPN